MPESFRSSARIIAGIAVSEAMCVASIPGKDIVRQLIDFNSISAQCSEAFNNWGCGLLSNDSAPDILQGLLFASGSILGAYIMLPEEMRERNRQSIALLGTFVASFGVIVGEAIFAASGSSNFSIEDIVAGSLGSAAAGVIFGTIFHLKNRNN